MPLSSAVIFIRRREMSICISDATTPIMTVERIMMIDGTTRTLAKLKICMI